LLDLRLDLKSSKVLSHCTLLTLRIGPVQFVRRFAVMPAGIGLHHARIHREPFALVGGVDRIAGHVEAGLAYEDKALLGLRSQQTAVAAALVTAIEHGPACGILLSS
jgi:hypothetical protein